MVAQDLIFGVFCELQVKRVVFDNLELKRRNPTSRRLNVATSSRFLPQNHKNQWKTNFEASKNVQTKVRTGAQKAEQ